MDEGKEESIRVLVCHPDKETEEMTIPNTVQGIQGVVGENFFMKHPSIENKFFVVIYNVDAQKDMNGAIGFQNGMTSFNGTCIVCRYGPHGCMSLRDDDIEVFKRPGREI